MTSASVVADPTAVADPVRPTPFGELLRTYRAEALLTQAELADRAGLSLRQVQNLEAGRSRAPQVATLRYLATALSLDPARRRALGRAARRSRAVQPYAGRVTTEPTTARADDTADVLLPPNRYAKPAALTARPTEDARPCFYADPDPSFTAPGTYAIVHAYPSTNRAGQPAWHGHVMATGVAPLDAVTLLDALRAHRAPLDPNREGR